MGHGGKREGAGRKRGSGDKIDKEIRAGAMAAGVTPLDYMLGVMRDERQDAHRRDEMAKASAPYMHARLSQVSGDPDKPIVTIKRIERVIVSAAHVTEEDEDRPTTH